LAAREIGVDRGNVDVEACGHAFDRRDQLGAVRFAGSQKAQHRFVSPPARSFERASMTRFNQTGRARESGG